MKRISIFMLVVMMVFMTSACGKGNNLTSREKERTNRAGRGAEGKRTRNKWK